MRDRSALKALSDDQILSGLYEVLRKTRHDEADLVAHIAEVDARRLYAREATPSMFVWCTARLHLSESEAYLRIAVARASRRHPMLLSMLEDGRLHLSGIERLAPQLTVENRDVLLKRAAHRSRRQIEQLVAEVAPRPAAPTRVRKLPERGNPSRLGCSVPSLEAQADGVDRPVAGEVMTPELPPSGAEPGGPHATLDGLCLDEVGPIACDTAADGVGSGRLELRPDGVGPADGVVSGTPELRPDGSPALRSALMRPTRAVEAVAPSRFRLQFDLDTGLRNKLERLQALMRSSVPDGDLGKVIEIAVTRELERLEARRFAKTKRPRKRLAQTDTRPQSRYIPAAVRRHVEERDGGRCTYRDRHGRRCPKRHDLEFHHRKPFGRGGDHSPDGVALMCRTHNALLAERDYGREKMARARRQAVNRGKKVEVVSEPSAAKRLEARWRPPG